MVQLELLLTHKAVAAQGAGGVDAQYGGGQQLFAQQQGDGMHRPDELGGLVAPAHGLGDGQSARACSTMAGSSSAAVLPLTSARCTSHSPLSVFSRPACSMPMPLPAAQPRAALVGLPSASKAACTAGPRFSICLSAWPCGQPGDLHRQSAGGGVPAHLGEGQLGVGQLKLEVVGEGFAQGAQRLGRQLFGTDFYQEILFGHALILLSCTWGSPGLRGRRSRPRRRPWSGCGCAVCSAGVRLPKSPCGHPAG
jgi:hypothetical protein